MVALGILFAPVDIWIKAYFAMGAAFLVQSTITMTKTLRDVHEKCTIREPDRGRQGRAPPDGDRARQELSCRPAAKRPIPARSRPGRDCTTLARKSGRFQQDRHIPEWRRARRWLLWLAQSR